MALHADQTFTTAGDGGAVLERHTCHRPKHVRIVGGCGVTMWLMTGLTVDRHVILVHGRLAINKIGEALRVMATHAGRTGFDR